MDLNELKQKPLWQMTGEEFLYLQKKQQRKNQQSNNIDTCSRRKRKTLRVWYCGYCQALWMQYAHGAPHQEKRKN